MPSDESRIRTLASRLKVPVMDAVIQALSRISAKVGRKATLLAVCPNSTAVVRAAIKTALSLDAPLCFAATLNQVDVDGGYTGWTPAAFVALVKELASSLGYEGPVIVGLDHGGPWLKDAQRDWPFEKTWNAVKESFAAFLLAGYDLLHVDCTIDPSATVKTSISTVIERTLALISFSGQFRREHNLQRVSYEVGTEEVHGGLGDPAVFVQLLDGLKEGLAERGLSDIWPCFVVGKVGTNLHTTNFDSLLAKKLSTLAARYGSVIKGHYTDYVEKPEQYPVAGMGGANVGPEFTEAEYEALMELCCIEENWLPQHQSTTPSHFREVLEKAVVESGRWKKWRLPEEVGKDFFEYAEERRSWLVRTGCRYVWTLKNVMSSRLNLYSNLRAAGYSPEEYVEEKISAVVEKYIRAFGLPSSNTLIERELEAMAATAP